MYSDRINYGLSHFLEKSMFLSESSKYTLHETTESGKGQLTVSLSGDNLCIEDFDNCPKCSFVNADRAKGMKKSVDHIIFKKKDHLWELHMIEMKTTVDIHLLLDLKQKFRASYFDARAIALFLGIEITDDNVFLYTTYETDKVQSSSASNPFLKKGRSGQFFIKAENDWQSEKFHINFGCEKKFPHKRIKMERTESDGLIGSLTI